MTTSNVNQSENATAEESRGNRRRAGEERIDVVFEVLADARRRRIVRLLRTREDGVATVPELTEALAVREPGDREPSRITVSLRHVHLPKLDATGVVEYAADQSQVRYADPPLVEHLLDQI
jgi:DNA-binding transcriptional ArsR family regulator